MPNCAADHSSWPSGTPASGTSTLPTMGRNSAGVIDGQAGRRHQRPSTQTVTPSWPRLPAHHSRWNAGCGPSSSTATVATRIAAIGSAAMNVWRTGCRRSSAQASGWRQPRSAVSTSSSANTTAARPPVNQATTPAISPISGTARCQASARPLRPITMAYQPGTR